MYICKNEHQDCEICLLWSVTQLTLLDYGDVKKKSFLFFKRDLSLRQKMINILFDYKVLKDETDQTQKQRTDKKSPLPSFTQFSLINSPFLLTT